MARCSLLPRRRWLMRHPRGLLLVSVSSLVVTLLLFQLHPDKIAHFGREMSWSQIASRLLSPLNSGFAALSALTDDGHGTSLRPSRAVCVGSNFSLGEVEDVLCLPKPDYDPSMKNPCWWDSAEPDRKPAPRVPASAGKKTLVRSLSCLPYFHILCCCKSGTTDLYHRLRFHPDIVPNLGIFGKERLWWGWAKYGIKDVKGKSGTPVRFSLYVSGFGGLARDLERAAIENPKDLKRLVTLDGSPPDLFDLRGWDQLPQNRNLRQPAVLTPHLMRYLYRNPKFLVLVREPVERLYSTYLFHGMGSSADQFHQDVIRGIVMFERCLANAPKRIECFVNGSVNDNMPILLHTSCYGVYFAEWLKVFPKYSFMFLRTEDYSQHLNGTLLQVFDFLDLARPSPKTLQRMLQAPRWYNTMEKAKAGPMLRKTRVLLQKWYQPWNKELAHLLGDSRFLWNDVYDGVINT